MLDRARKRHGLTPGTLAADGGYGAGEFLRKVGQRGITPHAAMARGTIKATAPSIALAGGCASGGAGGGAGWLLYEREWLSGVGYSDFFL
ncbi:MAG TPA: hypothetical protein DEB06_06470 [Phycisphaerales bacterium]|nr:hypothetical protein [Phycisphaerales bacterium]